MNINHKLLIIARESRGLTQKQLVDKIENLNQGNYSKMEKGILSISPEILKKIAEALDYQESFFYKKSIISPVSSFYYRRRFSLTKKELSVLEAKIEVIRTMIDELLDSVEIPQFNLPCYKVTDDLSASDIAIRIREFLKLPRGVIKSIIPVLESAGIIIYFLNGVTNKFDGITVITDGGQPIIFINNDLPNDRKNFTICHELAHLCIHIPHSPLPQSVDEEKEANEFAGEFLMPYKDCRNDLLDLRFSQLSILKSIWKVSKAAIIRRAFDTGTISESRYTNLNIELSRNGEKKKENTEIEIEEPKILPLIIKAYENDLDYSFDELLKLLGFKEKDYFGYFKTSKYKPIVTISNKVINISSYQKQKKELQN